MSDLTPPPERDLSQDHRQAIRAALHDARPGSRRTPVLAAAAVAAIVAAGLVIPQLRSGDRPQPTGPATTVTSTTPTPSRSATRIRTTPGRTIPMMTPKPAKDPVLVCRDAMRDSIEPGAAPGKQTREFARIDGRWGVTLILTDDRRWIGCDTTNYTYGKASLLRPRGFTRPETTDVSAYAVSNVAVPEPSTVAMPFDAPIYDHYFAAGVLPRGVTGIRYVFPDGVAEKARISGRFWLVEHLESQPISPNQSSRERERIKVELLAADGSVLRTHRLKWGTQTCAHVNHGC